MQGDTEFNVTEFREDAYSEGEFDIKKFNKEYDVEMKKLEKSYKEKQEQLLDEYDEQIIKKNIHNLTLGDVIINMKKIIYNIIIEITTLDFNGFDGFVKIFTKENRMFYFGVFLLIVSFLFFLLSINSSYGSKSADLEGTSVDTVQHGSKRDDVNIYLNL